MAVGPRWKESVVHLRAFAGAEGASGPAGPSYGKVTPEGGRFWQPDTRYSCAPPPWGELVAVNANTGDIAWRAPLGNFDELAAKGLKTGTPNTGGSIATAGNLIFIGASTDSKFRAFDAKTGKELWSVKVDAPAHSIPATYLGKDGKQYVVVSAAGGGFLRDPTSDAPWWRSFHSRRNRSKRPHTQETACPPMSGEYSTLRRDSEPLDYRVVIQSPPLQF